MDSQSQLLSFPDEMPEEPQAGLSGLVNSIKMMAGGNANPTATAASEQEHATLEAALLPVPLVSAISTSPTVAVQNAEVEAELPPLHKQETKRETKPKSRSTLSKILVDPAVKPSTDTTNAAVYGVKSRRGVPRRVPSISSSTRSFDPNSSIGSVTFTGNRGNDTESISSEFAMNFLSNFTSKRDAPGLGKEYWLDDSSAVRCGSCEKNFNAFRRRHHCRICGKIFCGGCTLFISGDKFNYTGKMRVCHNCLKFADQYDDATASSDESVFDETNSSMTMIRPTKSHDSTVRPRSMTPSIPDQLTSKEIFQLQNGVGTNNETNLPPPPPLPPMIAIPATRKGESVEIDLGGKPTRGNSVHSAGGRRPRSGTMHSTHRYGQITFNDSNANSGPHSGTRHRDDSTGFKYFQPFQSQTDLGSPKTPTPSTDVKLDRSPMLAQTDTMSISGITADEEIDGDSDDGSDKSDGEQTMHAYSSMIMGSSSNLLPTARSSSRVFSGSSLQDRHSRTYRHKHRTANSFHRMKNRRMSKSISRVQNNSTAFDMNNLFPRSSSAFNFGETEEDEEQPKKFKASEEFSSIAETHASNLLHQLLVDRKIEDIGKWQAILFDLLKKITVVSPDLRSGESFDLPEYVKVKRIPGAAIEQSEFVEGIVFSKILALKSMKRKMENPRIAVITFPIEFEEGPELRLTSLDPLINQESEYLEKLVGRIAALKPDLVLSASAVNGYALELLANSGIAVAMNIKPQVIERIARVTGADIVTSINRLATDPKLGECGLFEEKTFVSQNVRRTYLFLTGCSPENGCTILLRGGDMELLRQVKDCAILVLYVIFNIKFESALLRDEFLIAPEYRYTPSDQSIYETPINDYHEFLHLLETRILSSTPWVKLQPPFVLTQLETIERYIAENQEQFRTFESRYSKIQELEHPLATAANDDTTSLDTMDEKAYQTRKELEELLNKWNIAIDIDKLPNKLGDLPSIVTFTKESRDVLLQSNFNGVKRQWELFWNLKNAQFLDPVTHQSLVVLYSMVSTKNATPCIGPFIQELDYYWETDMCLGQYIEHVCLHADDMCAEGCGLQLKDHYRSYVHGGGKIDVVVENCPCRLVGWEHCILTWSYCKQCRTTTPVVPISDNTWKYSLGKYFEMSFWSQEIHVNGSCPHSFYRDHIRYFGLENLAVRIEHSDIECLELVPPRFQIMWKPEKLVGLKIEAFEQVKTKATRFFDSVLERLTRVKVDSMTLDKMEAGQKRIEELKTKLEGERQRIREMAYSIYNSTPADEHLRFNSVIRAVQELSVEWDFTFQEFISDFLPTEKDITRITAFQLRKFFMDNKGDMEGEHDPKEDEHEVKEDPQILERAEERQESPSMSSSPSHPRVKSGVLEKVSQIEAQANSDALASPSLSPTKPLVPPIRKFNSSNGMSLGIQPAFKMPIPLNTEFQHEMLKGRSASMSGERAHEQLSKLGLDDKQGKVKQLTDRFEELNFQELSKAFEMQREMDRRKMDRHRKKAAPVGASKPVVKVFENVQDAVGEEVVRPVSSQHRNSEADMKAPEDEKKMEQIEPEKTSLLKTLAHFWADRSATLWKPLEYPLLPSEHVFVDSDVIVREDEPSSLIAFCLSSSDYVSKLELMQSAEPDKSEDCSVHSDTMGDSICEAEKTMLKKTGIHLKYQFQEGNSTLSCKIFFAEQFDAFRRHCGCDVNFIQSLSRCVKWDSTGGKSGSAFLKTLDDRFIIKELSSVELEAFVKFAPSYFEYFAQALFHDLPTVLAKIFGFYQIQIKNPVDGRSSTMDVLIMENLFYGRKTSRIFDLKGSMRNRHVEQTGKENEVLLDENMVEYIYESPLFVREHAKKVLRASLWNDTLFLAKMNVMDYSLVIGIDSDNNELVVGIIDCIRTFTWDKKLESWVKEKGLVGGGGAGKEPTVITPKQYKNRFREAMERYILMVPGAWYINTR